MVLLLLKGIRVFSFGTWFAASESSESEPSDDDQGTAKKAGKLLKSGLDKARPLAAKAGSLTVEGAKKLGKTVASGSRWLTAKIKELIEQRRNKSGSDTVETAPENGEDTNPMG